MGVYINGMEMPTDCSRQGCPLFACIAAYKTGLICTVLNEYVENGKKNPRCPLIPVPPHGRLADMNELGKKYDGIVHNFCHGNFRSGWDFLCEVREILDNAPTIIEESGKEE